MHGESIIVKNLVCHTMPLALWGGGSIWFWLMLARLKIHTVTSLYVYESSVKKWGVEICISLCFAGFKVFLLNRLNQCFAGFKACEI